MKVLYFAWLRTRIGVAQEDVDLPADVATVGDLIDRLRARGGAYAEALARPEVIKAAVNQEHVPFSHLLKPGDEVALFPPVTGG
jgi:sulfur-carrier protein